jgi:TRAP-type C4-dicarboxylate transport system permease small subunit
MIKTLKKADDILARIMRWFVIGLCIGIGCILFLRVIIRFTPIHISLSWTDEVVEWMMAWMIFTGAALIMRKGDHFRVDIIQTKFEGRTWVHILNILITIMSLLFFSTLLYYSILLVQGAGWFSPILKVTTRLPYLSIPVNCVLILLYLIRDLITGFADLFKHRPQSVDSDAEKESC